MVTRILLAAILCLIPAYAAAQTGTGPGRDVAAIHHLIEQYAKAVDTVDPNLISQIWSHSPEVSFIYPLGEEHGFDAIAVVADTETLTPPCGACRQIIWEFCGDVPVILANLQGKVEYERSGKLLPRAFDAGFL